MSRSEIKSRFDEIVEFAEVAKFLDTPVKRYSSGMYVRLAFSVAAHLEPEILIVDEVLAVGDVEFQKKCLGKMSDVSKGAGRTVLFVSHNLSAVLSLCDKGIYLKKGQIRSIGDTDQVVNAYLSGGAESGTLRTWITDHPGDGIARLHAARIINEAGETVQGVSRDQRIAVEFEYEVLKSGYKPIPNIHIFTTHGEPVFTSAANNAEINSRTGRFITRMWIPADFLNERQYVAGLGLTTFAPMTFHFFEQEALRFSVLEDISLRKNDFTHKFPGTVHPALEWTTEEK
jgi:lipopolysaccharide transport system ATP-binding protein